MLIFNQSQEFTLGAELEIQIINRRNYDLIPQAIDVISQLNTEKYKARITPEITQSMLEINSSIQNTPHNLLAELQEIRNFLLKQISESNIYICGGGTHPFQMWNDRKIYPKNRYRKVAEKYGYLAKMFTVFGLHIHVGCNNGDDAIYLTNAFSRFVPHFIALSASSPFCQGIDTGFASARANVAALFPLSGQTPVTQSWRNFCAYFEKMQQLQVVKKLDHMYWDVRPRPEFGTVELRVCDAPLSLEKIAMLAAYAQTLARFCVKERPYRFKSDKYHLYRFNRFQASRYGFKGIYIDPLSEASTTIDQDIFDICDRLKDHAKDLGNDDYIANLIETTVRQENDAKWLRDLFEKGKTLRNIVRMQSKLWADDLEIEPMVI